MKELGNPFIASAVASSAGNILATKEGRDFAVDVAKEARKSATSGLKIVAGIIFAPFVIGGVFIIAKSLSKSVADNRNQNLWNNNSNNPNFQLAIEFREYLDKEDIPNIFKSIGKLSYIEDWNEVQEFYKQLYKGSGILLDPDIDKSGVIYSHIKNVLNNNKLSTFNNIISAFTSKNSASSGYYLKAKRDTSIFFDFRGQIRSIGSLLKKHTIQDGIYHSSIEKNGVKYIQFKTGTANLARKYLIPFKDIILIFRSDYESIINNGFFVSIS